MKKFCLIFCVCLCFLFCTCCSYSDNKNETTAANNINEQVAEKVCEIQGYENLDDEIIKALSVIIRTNIINQKISTNYTSNEIDEHILKLTKQTDGEILDRTDEIIIKTKDDETFDTWQSEIKKSSLLEFLAKNDISLTNISSVEPIFDEDNNFESLKIGGKSLSYEELKEPFNLKSQKITNIENNLTNIIITGEYEKNNNIFDLEEAENVLFLKENYGQLLNHFNLGYNSKTTTKNAKISAL